MPFIYFLMGQAGWFACVISAARGAAWIGVAFAIVLLAVHLWRANQPIEEAKLIASVIVIGGIWDSGLVSFGLLAYPSSTVISGVAPVWIFMLWGMFAAQVNTTYRWLKLRIWLAPLLGAVAGPLSFRAGAALGAVQFVKPWPTATALAIGWSALMPAIITLSRRWNGVR